MTSVATMAEARSAPVVTVSYSDLAKFDEGGDRNPLLLESVARAFGPDGLGILAVEGIPDFEGKRRRLLPLAARLPFLPDLAECERPDLHYSIGWSHGKEQLRPGVPDVAKGSYYADPFREASDPLSGAPANDNDNAAADSNSNSNSNSNNTDPFHATPWNVWPRSLDLRTPFVEMSALIAGTGRLLARVCDAYCHDVHGVDLGLNETLTRSSNAKGRLLHYFDMSAAPPPSAPDAPGEEPLWCGWHNDHGSLTGLVPAMYLNEDGEEVSKQGDTTCGLFIQSRSGDVVRVALPAGACGFQIGEATQIQSGDLFVATPHAVRFGGDSKGITRETFALFMQPDMDVRLEPPSNRSTDATRNEQPTSLRGVAPLEQRWKPGCTFGDFHAATLSAFTMNRTGGL